MKCFPPTPRFGFRSALHDDLSKYRKGPDPQIVSGHGYFLRELAESISDGVVSRELIHLISRLATDSL
jgi:hypothetical protein